MYDARDFIKFILKYCRFTIDVLHSDIFSFKTSLNKNMSAKKEYGNSPKCVIVKLPHKT